MIDYDIMMTIIK